MTKLILGVDPGLANTGLGIIERNGDSVKYISHYLISTKPKQSTHKRLETLFLQAQEILKNYKIDQFIIEELFVGINRNTIIKLSMARSMLLLLGSMRSVEILNVPTRLVKQKITGNGAASKENVNQTVCDRLKIKLDQLDCTDALACALYEQI